MLFSNGSCSSIIMSEIFLGYYLISIQGAQHLGPAIDFYKKFALDCSGQQVAVDLFLLSGQYSDMASLGKRIFITVKLFL